MSLRKTFLRLILAAVFFSNTAAALTSTPPKIGNFALPSSQQPGPLISFGENIIDKGQSQIYLFGDYYAGIHKHTSDVIGSYLYGISNTLSIFLNIPYAVSYHVNDAHSKGWEDVFAQLEYVFYTQSNESYVDQATIVGDVTLPTGSSTKLPSTGFGAPSVFVGATFNRTYVDWFAFTSYGATLPTRDGTTHFGDQFFYEYGVGRNICSIEKSWIFAWMVEGTGQYSQKNTIEGIIDQNSGGNLFYVTPSIWISSKSLIFQLGIGWAVAQHLFGNQKDFTYSVVANVGWTFY